VYVTVGFLRATARSAKRVLAIVILHVCPSVTTLYRFTLRWDRDSGVSRYDSVESLVSCEQISCRWVRRFPSNKGIKEGYFIKNRYLNTISLSSMRTVADRHRLAAYHNKHCWRSFREYQRRWPWTTLNHKNRCFQWIFRDFRLRHKFEEWTAPKLLNID